MLADEVQHIGAGGFVWLRGVGPFGFTGVHVDGGEEVGHVI